MLAPRVLDVSTMPGLVNVVRAAGGSAVDTVLLDMAPTLSCDVLGLSELRAVRDELAERGVRLLLDNPPPRLALLLEACGLSDSSSSPRAADGAPD